MATGNFEEAEKHFLESENIFEETSNTEHLKYAEVLVQHGVLYLNIANYQLANEYFNRAKIICETMFYTEMSVYYHAILNLGISNMRSGKFEIAENYLLETQSAWKKQLGKSIQIM